MSEEYLALIPAAGIGSRAQLKTAKQFSKIGDKTIIEYSMDLFLRDDNCKSICVITNEDNDVWTNMPISNHEKVISCFGGLTRMASVLAGLELLMDKEDKSSLVVIHDAARPCLQKDDFNSLMEYADEEIKEEGQGAFLAYQPNESTSLCKKEFISEALDRSKVWLAATPQVFILEDVFNALTEAVAKDITFSDEVSAVFSHFKSEIKPISSSRMNLKVTKKEDIDVVALYLKLLGRL